jgi:hypothetical protein
MTLSPRRAVNPAATIQMILCFDDHGHRGFETANKRNCRSIKFEMSAVLFVWILGLAITSPICRPAAMLCGILDYRRIGVFDHELIADDEAMPKHLRGISCQSPHRGRAAQHQCADDLHGVSP